MNENGLAYGIEISDLDWEKTPANVKELVEKMGQHIKQSEERLAEQQAKQQELLEKINRTSLNSSSPPLIGVGFLQLGEGKTWKARRESRLGSFSLQEKEIIKSY